MFKKAAIVAALMVAGVSAADATTVTYDSTTYTGPTNFTNAALAIQQFDPSLGTLTGISLTLNGTVVANLRFESQDNAPSTVTATAMASVSLSRPNGTNLVVVLPTQSRTQNETAYDGTLDFGGSSGDTFLNQTGTLSSTVSLDPIDFSLFTGTGFVNALLSAVGTSSVTGPGNVVTSVSTQASGQASVTYSFDAAAVPEPATWAMMVGGFGLVGAAMRRRTKVAVKFA